MLLQNRPETGRQRAVKLEISRLGIVVYHLHTSNVWRFYRAMSFYETVLVPGYYRGGEGRKEGALRMLRVLRTPGPVPFSVSIASPASLASLRARGLVKIRPRRSSAGAGRASAGTGTAAAGTSGTSRRTAIFASGGVSGATPREASSASMSGTCSPGAPRSAMGLPTSTSAPAATRVLIRTPAADAGISTSALSVSTMTIASPLSNAAPSLSGQADRTASVAAAATRVRAKVRRLYGS